MSLSFTRLLPALVVGAFVAGCAADGSEGLFSTAALAPSAPPPPAATAPAPRVDTACLQLAGQIDTIKKDGTIEKLEKVAAGKSTSVQVKRAALAKQAELNRANADYMAKCGPAAGARTAAAPATVTPVAPAAATAKVAATAKAATTSGVTVAPAKTQ